MDPKASMTSEVVSTPSTNGCNKPFDVNVTYPVKVGDGMSAYIVYHVVFTGHQPPFDLRTFNVTRRFSDFLGLHAKLLNQYQCSGIIIPSAPDKNVLGTTMVKMSKDTSLENEFIERRRIALERFLYRLLSHPVLRTDTNLREFLEHEGDLPRSVNTQLISGASAKKMFRNFGDVLGKITYKMEDPEEGFVDEYFDLKTEELESWERQLKRLHGALTSLVTSTQDLVSSKFAVSRAISQLANVEEHTGLAQALGRLADTEENVSQRYAMLADAELMYLADCARDTLGIIQACKDALDERWKAFRNWKSAENALRLKRELKVKLELAGRCDQRKSQGIDAELEELSVRVENEKNNFEKVTQVVKVELDRVDFTRFDDLKQAATQFLQITLQTQEKVSRAQATVGGSTLPSVVAAVGKAYLPPFSPRVLVGWVARSHSTTLGTHGQFRILQAGRPLFTDANLLQRARRSCSSIQLPLTQPTVTLVSLALFPF